MSSPVTTSYEAEVNTARPDLMFKALGGFILTAPMTVAIPAAFTTGAAADLIQQPVAWNRLGLLSKKDGIDFSRAIKTDEEESFGFNEPTRTDITSDVTSAKFTLQQTTRAALELYDFVDLSAVTPDAVTGEVAYNKPTSVSPVYRRMIYVAVDGAGTDRRYRIKIMPRAQVIAVGDESWNNSAVTDFNLTLRATVDTTLGYAVRNVHAGPGQLSRNTVAGFGS